MKRILQLVLTTVVAVGCASSDNTRPDGHSTPDSPATFEVFPEDGEAPTDPPGRCHRDLWPGPLARPPASTAGFAPNVASTPPNLKRAFVLVNPLALGIVAQGP
jgi:hypothetical protein